MRLSVALADSDSTEALGQVLAKHAPERAVVYLHGELGAGKSTLARAWLRALGVVGAIKSPTYTLIERYPLAKVGGDEVEAVHLDLYRIAAADELDFLGLDELAAVANLWLVEWPERGGRALPAADLQIDMAVHGEGRVAELEAVGPESEAWLARVATDMRLRGTS